MGYTISLVQLKRPNGRANKRPVYLRLYQDGKLIYINSGIYVEPKYWNDNKQEVRGSHDKHIRYNEELDRLKNLAENRALELRREGRLDIEIIREFIEGGGRKDLIEYAESYLEMVRENGRYWEYRKFKVVIRDLKRFLGNRRPLIGSIDAGFLEDFQNYLLGIKRKGKVNNPNTTRRKLRRLKGMFKHALKRKAISHDPFQSFDMVRQQPTERVKLSINQIRAIERLSLKRGSKLWHVRNYFLYSFYNAGIRFSDLCTLTWGNLIDGRLRYEMHKTGGKKSISQMVPMYRILFYYVKSPGTVLAFKNWEQPEDFFVARPADYDALIEGIVGKYATENRGEYIFPILGRKYSDDNRLKAKISSKNALVNRDLKRLAKRAGISSNISFHVSRHSFSQVALKGGMGLYQISRALGHKSLSTTEQYIKSFDEELLDKGMNKIFG